MPLAWTTTRSPHAGSPSDPDCSCSSVVQLGSLDALSRAMRAHVALSPAGDCVPHLPWKLAVLIVAQRAWSDQGARCERSPPGCARAAFIPLASAMGMNAACRLSAG